MERIVEAVPEPKGDPEAPLKALIFDSYYDSYRGVITYLRVMDGQVKAGDTIHMMATAYELWDFGVWAPILQSTVYTGLFHVGGAVLDGTYRTLRRGEYQKKRENDEETA